MRANRWRGGHRPGGSVLVRVHLPWRFQLRITLTPAAARTLAAAMTKHADRAEGLP
jgi:hypothetical protein